MPASEFTWNSAGSTPIFQVYGTKRKVSDVDQTWPQDSQAQNFQEEISAKRICSWNPDQITGFSNAANGIGAAAEINHNHLVTAPPTPFIQQQPMQQQENTLEEEHRNMFANCVPWPSEEINAAVQTPQTQDNFSMDLNEGTYSNSRLPADLSQAHSAMDSDCCPDPEQYHLTPNDQAQHPVQPSHDIRSDFCTNFCGSGDCSPKSGRVRCYCKPSWEGMMDIKPYISDYY